MFRKREKKIFPPGTFIEPKARIAAILQLCFAFSIFLWIASQPFMGDLFAIKSEMMLIETVFGTRPHLPTDSEGLLKRNGKRFKHLLPDEKSLIQNHYEHLQKLSATPFKEKLKASLLLLTINTAPFVLAALFLSIAIPLLLLLKYDGAISASFLLPLIIFCAFLDNSQHKLQEPLDAMYPSEQELLENYVKEPLKTTILDQHAQLKKGWLNFLIVNWAKELPSEDEITFNRQLEKGEHAFNVEQAKKMAFNGFVLPSSLKNQKTSPLLLTAFLLMSMCFAAAAALSKRNKQLKPSCTQQFPL